MKPSTITLALLLGLSLLTNALMLGRLLEPEAIVPSRPPAKVAVAPATPDVSPVAPRVSLSVEERPQAAAASAVPVSTVAVPATDLGDLEIERIIAGTDARIQAKLSPDQAFQTLTANYLRVFQQRDIIGDDACARSIRRMTAVYLGVSEDVVVRMEGQLPRMLEIWHEENREMNAFIAAHGRPPDGRDADQFRTQYCSRQADVIAPFLNGSARHELFRVSVYNWFNMACRDFYVH